MNPKFPFQLQFIPSSPNYEFTDNNPSYPWYSYHKNLSQASSTTKIPKIRWNWIGQFVSPGGLHLVARRCIARTQKISTRSMSRLAALKVRQAVSGNLQKFNRIRHKLRIHIAIIQYSTKTYNYHQTHK